MNKIHLIKMKMPYHTSEGEADTTYKNRYFVIGKCLNCNRNLGRSVFIGEPIKKRNWLVSKYLSVILVSFIFACVISLTPKTVKADYFYPSGDTVNCNIAQSTSITVNRLPENIDKDDSISYDSHLVVGQYVDFPQNHTITDIADITYPDARRYLGVADRVSAPPDAVLDVGYFVFNYSGHQVDVVNGYFFFSKTDQLGDWGRFGINGPTRSVSYLINGTWVNKVGKTIYKENWGSWPVSSFSAPPRGTLIGQITLGEQIQYDTTGVSYEINESSEIVANITVIVKNIAGYDLTDLEYRHGTFSEQFALSKNGEAGDTKEINYSLNLGRNYGRQIDIGRPAIINNSQHTECLLEAGQNWNSTNPDTRSIVTFRSDQNAGSWLGSQIDLNTEPSGDSMCITMIPYTKHLKSLYIDVLPQLSSEITLSDNDEISTKSLSTFVAQTSVVNITVADTIIDGKEIKIALDFKKENIRFLDTCGGRIYGDSVIWDEVSIANNAVWSCNLTFVSENVAEDVNFNVFARIDELDVESNHDNAIVDIGELPKVNVEKSMQYDVESKKIIATVSFEVDALGDGRSIILSDVCDNCPENYEYLGNVPLNEVYYPTNENYLLKFEYLLDAQDLSELPKIVNNCFFVHASDFDDSEGSSEAGRHNIEIAKSCISLALTIDGGEILPDWETLPQNISEDVLPDQLLVPETDEGILSFFSNLEDAISNGGNWGNDCGSNSQTFSGFVDNIADLPYLLFENTLANSGFAFSENIKIALFSALILIVACVTGVILWASRRKEKKIFRDQIHSKGHNGNHR